MIKKGLPVNLVLSPEDLQSRNAFLYENHPSLWVAINHHKTHKNKHLTFERHAYLRDLYLDDSDFIAVKKSVQCGVSEWLIVKALVEAKEGRSVFYVLPTIDLKNRFVQNRWDRSVLYTPYYQQLYREAGKTKSAESVSLKHVGRGVIAYAGSNSPAPFTEFPADTYIVDEEDRCDRTTLAMGEERLSHSDRKKQFRVSNPTFPNRGIDVHYRRSDKKKWFIKCESCGEWINPDFFKNVVMKVDSLHWVTIDPDWDKNSPLDIRCYCHKCGTPFDRFAQGEWVKEDQSALISGYQISKMFSSNNTVADLVDRFVRGLGNDSIMERFYNGDLGQTYESEGAKLTVAMLDECVVDYNIPDHSDDVCVMGIDVGKTMHVMIAKIDGERLQVLFIGQVREEMEIIELAQRYNVKFGVIDAMPENRMSRKICANIPGMFMCFYGGEKRDTINMEDKIITTDRTYQLDTIKEMVLLQKLDLPMNAPSIEGFYLQMTVSTRIYDQDKDRYYWDEGTEPDHYFHSCGYMMLAKRLSTNLR